MPTHLDQRSIVTVLAVDIVNSTRHVARADPDAVQEFLDFCFQRIEHIVCSAGGTIISFTGDGALTVFGWPNGLDDHADKACMAACALQETLVSAAAPDNASVGVRIGVHTGLVGLRKIDFGSGSRLDVVGATVHFAAALEKAAPRGATLISSETLALCRGEIEAQPHPAPEAFKSMGGEAYLLRRIRDARNTGLDTHTRYHLPLVGRDKDLGRLLGMIETHGAVAAVVGEPGIGKSRLVAELNGRNRAHVCFCDALKQAAPYEAFRSAVQCWLPDDAGEAKHQIDSALRDCDEDVSASVFAALNPSTPPNRDRRGKVTQAQTARALAQLLAALMSENERLILEDLHWADAESRLCIDFLVQPESGFRGRLVVTARPETADYLANLTDNVLTLEPLSATCMYDIASRLDADNQLSAVLRDAAVLRAEGVPLVLEQFVQSARHLALSAESEIPLGVESLIHARINRLAPELKRVVQTLAVLGEEVEFDVAAATTDIDQDCFCEMLQDLAEHALLHPDAKQTVRFRHALVADACRTMLTRRRSKALHAAAMSAIEARYQQDPRQLGRLAHHASHSGNDRRALEYYWQAGRHARRQSARQSMKLIFDQALQATERIGPEADCKVVDFVLLAFDSLHQIGELERLMPLLLRTIDLTRAADQSDKVCVALCHLGMAHWLDGRYANGVGYAEEALVIAKRLDRLPLIHYAQHTLAALLHMIGRVHRAIDLMSELCDMFDGPNRTIRLGGAEVPGSMSRGFLAEFLVEVGRYDEALSAGKSALEIAQSEREPFSEVMARIGLGEAHLYSGDSARAIECLSPAKDQLEHFGFWPSDATVSGHLATALARNGRGEEALQVSQRVFDLKRITTPRAMHTLWAGHTEALCAAQGPSAALNAADYTVEFARARGAVCRLVQALGTRARILDEMPSSNDRAERDRNEQAELCAEFGLVAWTPTP